jgi:CDP-diacylglycerol--serine O-phosphatidyltransferase
LESEDKTVLSAEDNSPSRRQRFFWLPNAITICGLFSGFYAIVQGMNHEFGLAAIGIFAAMIFDGLDGRVARLTQTQSAFGAQFDSLADMVAFGAAPALVLYEAELRSIGGKLAWVAAFIYVGCAALRLARFNTNMDTVEKSYFQGLPSPAAAGVVAGFIWATTANDFQGLPWVAWVLAVTLGFTMVSNIKYYSGKEINLRKAVPFSVVVLISFFVILVINSADNLPELLFLTFLSYFLSGFVAWVVVYFKNRRAQMDLKE